MIKVCALTVLAAVLSGCAGPGTTWKGKVEWPDTYAGKNVVPFMEAGAALAAIAAVREMIKQNPYPDLFRGCSSPEQGLDVGVFKGPTPGVYYVLVDQRFDRCGGPRVRVLDGWYEYAVTPRGEVVAEAPAMDGAVPRAANTAGADTAASHPPPPNSPATEPAAQPPASGTDTPAPIPLQAAPLATPPTPSLEPRP